MGYCKIISDSRSLSFPSLLLPCSPDRLARYLPGGKRFSTAPKTSKFFDLIMRVLRDPSFKTLAFCGHHESPLSMKKCTTMLYKNQAKIGKDLHAANFWRIFLPTDKVRCRP